MRKNQQFNILNYIPDEKHKDQQFKRLYADCAMKKDILDRSLDTGVGIFKNLDYITGIPQITCGIDIKYIVHLFKLVHDLLSICYYKGIKSTSHLVKNVSDSYIELVDLLVNIFGVNVEKFMNERILLCSLIILCIYINKVLKIMYTKDINTPLKYLFLFKPRSNLKPLYEMLSGDDKKIFNEWAEFYISNTDNKLIKVVDDWFKRLTNNKTDSKDVYQVIKSKGVYKVNLSPIVLYTIDKHNLDRLQKIAHIRHINIHNIASDNIPPTIQINTENKTITPYETDEIMGYDIGEWGMDINNTTFYIEIRSVKIIKELIECNKTTKNRLGISTLCKETGNIIFNFL